MAKQFADHTGKTFGRLTVIDRAENREFCNGRRRARWNCRCECGNAITVDALSLTTGHTKSCGCIKRDCHWNTRHGHTKGSRTRTFRIWVGMRQRAGNGYAPLDSRWNSFESFLADMGECPEGLTLDRIDGPKGYRPGNCRWATRVEQARNRKTTRWITYNGETLTLKEWAERLGVGYGALTQRLRKGVPLDRALQGSLRT